MEASERAFKYFVETDHWQHHDHWLSYAINELTLYQPKREYFEFGINNFLAILPYIYHRFTQVPTVMELTMAAYALLERLKSMPEMSDLLARVPLEDFYAAMEERARKLLNGYFWEETAMFFKRPESIVGAFYIRHDAFRVRIDDIQHFLGGLVNYRKYLARRDHIPQPSEALLSGKVAVTSVESLEQEPILNSAITLYSPPSFKRFNAENTARTDALVILELTPTP
ncbi:MAG: hypothetical protein IJU71_06540 [Selenomonadaceae bacterium]|nr:hypothetical protein [Selenomonadaceae bacterium]